jgi:D-alanine-D-alanine ligase
MFNENSTAALSGNGRLRVAVLLGGRSSERGVSLSSGRRVAAALRECGHGVQPIDPAEGELLAVNWSEFDACFIALHGGAGEDGRVQRVLEEIGVPYTGSGPAASRIAMSKSATKGRFLQHAVPTPPGISFRAASDQSDVAAVVSRLRRLPFPLIIKPDGQGCSLGVSIAASEAEIPPAIEAASRYEPLLLAEPLIAGREFTVALMDRRPLPALEIVGSRTVFDYDSKFGGVPVEHLFPPEQETADLKSLAVEAADAVGTGGLCRVDMIRDHGGQVWILEVNTVPGMTEQSLVPMAAEKAGIGMPQLCDSLVRACMCEEVPV